MTNTICLGRVALVGGFSVGTCAKRDYLPALGFGVSVVSYTNRAYCDYPESYLNSASSILQTFSRLGEYVRNAAARPNEGGNPIGLSLFERAERTWVAARLRARGGNPGASGRLRELCAEFLESLVEDIDVEGGLGPGEPPLDVYILFTLFQMLLYAREPEVRAIWQRVCSRTQARIAAEQSGESVRGLEREAERGRTENLREGAIEGEIDEEEEDEIEEWSEFEAELGFEAQGDVEAEGEVETEGEVEAEGEVETYRQVFDRVRSEVEAAGFAGHNQVSDCDVSSTCSDTSWQEFDGEDGGIRSPTETENDVGETGQRDRTKNEGNGALLRQLAAWVGQRETGEQWTRGSEAVRVMGEVGVFSPSQSLRLDRGLSYQGSEGLRVHEADTLPVEFSTESDECPESGSTRAYSSRRSRPAVRARGICREEGGADKLILDMAALD